MARGRAYRFRRFGRGLNTADGVYNLREGYEDDPQGLGAECRDCLNVVSEDRGKVRKRDGSTTLFTDSDVKDLNAVDSDANALLLYSTTAGDLLARKGDGTTSTLVASGLSATARWKFLRLPEIPSSTVLAYYGCNGVDTPRLVTNTSGTIAVATWPQNAGTRPNGRYMVYAGNRVFVAGDDADRYRVYASNVGDPTRWDQGYSVQFDPDDGEIVTGLGTVGPYVLVFKERKVFVIYDLDTGANRKVTDQAGTLSPDSVIPSERGTFFLDAERGVMVTDGQEARRVSEQIQPTLDRIDATDFDGVVGAFWRNHYYLGAELDGTGTRYLLDYHLELDSWWLHSHGSVALATWDTGDGPTLLSAHATTVATLFVSGENVDAGTVFRATWSGPFHSFGSAHLLKRCREVHLDGSGTVGVYVANDFRPGAGTLEESAVLSDDTDTFGGSGTYGGSGTFGGEVTIGEDSLYSLGVGRVWSVTFQSEDTNTWEIDSYTMLMTARKD